MELSSHRIFILYDTRHLTGKWFCAKLVSTTHKEAEVKKIGLAIFLILTFVMVGFFAGYGYAYYFCAPTETDRMVARRFMVGVANENPCEGSKIKHVQYWDRIETTLRGPTIEIDVGVGQGDRVEDLWTVNKVAVILIREDLEAKIAPIIKKHHAIVLDEVDKLFQPLAKEVAEKIKKVCR